MSLREHYGNLLARSSELQTKMLSDGDAAAAFTIAHNATSDLERLIAALGERPEAELMRLALRELQFALLAASSAQYRHAYISTRLFIELMLGSIYFSAFEIKLRKWINNSQDIVWSSLVDKENGPFSKSFITAFCPDFAPHGAQFNAIAEAVYRECSEYVHGNRKTHGDPDQSLEFNRGQLIEWTDRLKSARISIIFAFLARYSDFLPKEQILAIEPIVLGELGDNPAVQNLYAR